MFSVGEILQDDRASSPDGAYEFSYATSDGITRKEQGAPTAPGGAVTQRGGWT